MRRFFLSLLIIITAAQAQFFIEPGTPPPLPEPQPLESRVYEPLGWDVLPPGCRARVTDDGLRVRSEPNLESEILDQLNSGDVVIIRDVGPRETIGSLTAHWYEFAEQEEEKSLGWCYGGFVEFEDVGDWHTTLQQALALVREGDPAAAHRLLAPLEEDEPLALLTKEGHSALALVYNTHTEGRYLPFHVICGADYGITLVTEEFSPSYYGWIPDERYLVWDTGTWVYGALYFADLATGIVYSPADITGREALYVDGGRFLLEIHRELYTPWLDPAEMEWINLLQGTDAEYLSNDIVLFDGRSFTLILPEERYYCWREATATGWEAAGWYFDVTAYPNLDPTRFRWTMKGCTSGCGILTSGKIPLTSASASTPRRVE
ncbi:SH3 domain-containing protein [bacterium]|nr:SH3 domain-containing protein [bacterium]